MVIHFTDRQAAERDLRANGFRPCKTGRWVKDELRASIHPVPRSSAVAVAYEEIPA